MMESADAQNSANSSSIGAIQRIDYVLVVDRSIKKTKLKPLVTKFVNNLQALGLIVEASPGNEIKDNIYIKIHLPQKAIEHFANIYDIDIASEGHNYIPISSINLQMTQTPLTRNRDIFQRAGEATNVERILILNEILSETKFAEDENKHGVAKLIRLGALKAAYPLHDGSYHFEEKGTGPLNDRQLLLKYWATFSLWYKEQPLNLIQKYYGTEVAFYFAWLGFYNTMLIPAAIVGVICFLISVLHLNFFRQELIQEICNSNLTMCPLCHSGHSCIYKTLKNACYFANVSVIFDNQTTVFFAVFMSFWATVFLNLWRRLENVLKMRWNVESVEDDTKIRLQFKETATHKRLSIATGQMEPYVPMKNKIFKLTLSYGTSMLLVSIVLLAVIGVIMYRLTMAALIRMSNSPNLKSHSAVLLTSTSGILQVIFIKIFGRFYGRTSEWLTQLENPRTQSEFDNSVVHKRYFLGFVNNYASLFYIAFFKGRFYTPAHKPTLTSFVTDICHLCGCLTALCIQLFFMMLLKSMAGNILTLIVPIVTKIFKKRLKKPVASVVPQWEEEFALNPADRYLLTTEFMEMIVQYGFVTFFVGAFPLAPLCALINNSMELRLDAYKLVVRYRRPVPRQIAGIGAWNNILEAITHLSTATNAFVIAFTSDFVARQIYRYKHGNSLEGYIKSTLSIYDMKDSGTVTNQIVDIGKGNSTLCYYRALRYPPDHPKKYQLTPQYWYEVGIRLVCVIVFEHVVLLLNGILAYFIPDLPRTVRDTIQHEKDTELERKLKEKKNFAKAMKKHKNDGM